MQLFYQPGLQQGALHLDAEESGHCIRVLRKSLGDVIDVIDGKGTWVSAKITEANAKQCRFEVLEKRAFPPDNYHIHIAIAPTKNMDRMEWFVEKSVEIGIHEISFIFCQNSERTSLKTDRLEKKAISAMKQSIKYFLPAIHPACKFDEWLQKTSAEEKYIAALRDGAKPLAKLANAQKSYAVLVGPEGDFTQQEIARAVESGFQIATLGNSRLRTETAGLAACHILNLANQ